MKTEIEWFEIKDGVPPLPKNKHSIQILVSYKDGETERYYYTYKGRFEDEEGFEITFRNGEVVYWAYMPTIHKQNK